MPIKTILNIKKASNKITIINANNPSKTFTRVREIENVANEMLVEKLTEYLSVR